MKLSIIGKDSEIEDQAVGFYNVGDRVKYGGKMGAFWGGLRDLLFSAACFWVLGTGLFVIGGPIISWLVVTLERAAVVSGVSALGAALYNVIIPRTYMRRSRTDSSGRPR